MLTPRHVELVSDGALTENEMSVMSVRCWVRVHEGPGTNTWTHDVTCLSGTYVKGWTLSETSQAPGRTHLCRRSHLRVFEVSYVIQEHFSSDLPFMCQCHTAATSQKYVMVGNWRKQRFGDEVLLLFSRAGTLTSKNNNGFNQNKSDCLSLHELYLWKDGGIGWKWDPVTEKSHFMKKSYLMEQNHIAPHHVNPPVRSKPKLKVPEMAL